MRDGVDGLLVPPGDALALAEALRALALDAAGARAHGALRARERAERFAWPHVAAEVLDCYEHAIAHRPRRADGAALAGVAVRYGLAPADLQPRIPAERLPSLQPSRPRAVAGAGARRRARCAAAALAARLRWPAARSRCSRSSASASTRVAASLVASKPGPGRCRPRR